jgi:6-phosphogluconolactonase/glucosamine-6-phosphate isomerase/deaminase
MFENVLLYVKTKGYTIYLEFHMKPLGNLSRTEIEYLIDEWIVGMNHAERNRRIMKRKIIDGVTYEKLAEEFELSDVQVKNIVYQCKEKLKGKTV